MAELTVEEQTITVEETAKPTETTAEKITAVQNLSTGKNEDISLSVKQKSTGEAADTPMFSSKTTWISLGAIAGASLIIWKYLETMAKLELPPEYEIVLGAIAGVVGIGGFYMWTKK